MPQNVWAVLPNGMVLEAQLENREQATYHGYPLPQHDPLTRAVLDAWEEADG